MIGSVRLDDFKPELQEALSTGNKIPELTKIILERYRVDPVFYVSHALKVPIWSKMIEILESVRCNKKTCIHACYGASKTFTMACAALWLYHRDLNADVRTTAPTERQVKHLLWKEIGNIYRNARVKPIGDLLKMEIYDPNHITHKLLGFVGNDAASIQGMHSYFASIVIDEAKGVEDFFFTSGKRALSGPNSRFLIASTVDSITSDIFKQILTERDKNKDWHLINIDWNELPPQTGEKLKYCHWTHPFGYTYEEQEKTWDLDLNIQLSDKSYKKDCISDYGEGTAIYKAVMHGEVVEEDPSNIIPVHKVKKAFQNYELWKEGHWDKDALEGTYRMAMDPAGEGKDLNAVYRRRGRVIEGPFTKVVANVQEKISLVFDNCVDYNEKNFEYVFDSTGGYAEGVENHLEINGFNVIRFIFNKTAFRDKDRQFRTNIRYANRGTQLWWDAAKYIDEFAIQPNRTLLKQLTQRKIGPPKIIDGLSVRTLEPKEKYKSRTGESPDLADACLMAISNRIEKRAGPM